jgi:hypothetical protein
MYSQAETVISLTYCSCTTVLGLVARKIQETALLLNNAELPSCLNENRNCESICCMFLTQLGPR